MGQTKIHSLIEQILNVGTGFIISLLVWILIVAPLYDIEVTMFDNLAITAIFTIFSIARGYVWRRVFNKIHLKRLAKNAEY